MNNQELIKYTPEKVIQAFNQNVLNCSFSFSSSSHSSLDFKKIGLDFQNNEESIDYQINRIDKSEILSIFQFFDQKKSFFYLDSLIHYGFEGLEWEFKHNDKKKLRIVLGKGLGYLRIKIHPQVHVELELDYDILNKFLVNFPVIYLDIHIAKGASLKLLEKIVNYDRVTSDDIFSARLLKIDIQRQGKFDHFFDFNHFFIKYFRNEIHISLNEHESKCLLYGACEGRNDVILENITSINHLVSRTFSDQYYKVVGRDHSKITGLHHVVIQQNSLESETTQLTRVLMLSNHNEINIKPMLDIRCDQVKANHGVAYAQISLDEIFYLETRGLNSYLVKILLEKGFLNEVRDLWLKV